MLHVQLILLLTLALPVFAIDHLGDTIIDLDRCPCNGNAPSVAADTHVKGAWRFEERAPDFNNPQDASSFNNDLTAGASRAASTTEFRDGCRSLRIQSANITTPCSGGACSQFNFASSFTLLCWMRPDDVAAATKFILNTRANTISDGYSMEWLSAGLATPGNFRFTMQKSGTAHTISSFSTYAAEAWHHVAARYDAGNGNTIKQLIDGVLDANTGAAVSLTAWSSTFALGRGAFNRSLTGYFDMCVALSGAIIDADLRRIAVCGITGCGCTCNGTAYTHADLAAANGGPIVGTLSDCNKSTLDEISTTTITTTSSTTTTL